MDAGAALGTDSTCRKLVLNYAYLAAIQQPIDHGLVVQTLSVHLVDYHPLEVLFEPLNVVFERFIFLSDAHVRLFISHLHHHLLRTNQVHIHFVLDWSNRDLKAILPYDLPESIIEFISVPESFSVELFEDL